MLYTIKDIIVNALSDAKLVNRGQPCPADIFESARVLFSQRAAKYSNTNLLEFTRREFVYSPKDCVRPRNPRLFSVGHPFWNRQNVADDLHNLQYDFNKELKEEREPKMDGYKYFRLYPNKEGEMVCFGWWHWDGDESTTYYWKQVALSEVIDTTIEDNSFPEFDAKNLSAISKVYYRCGQTNNWMELKFVAYEDFDGFPMGSLVYSFLPTTDSLGLLMIRSEIRASEFKVVYNVKFDTSDTNKRMNIPEKFVALFTTALTYDLACAYPRLSDNTIAILKQKLDDIEGNIRKSSVANKIILRDEGLPMDNYDIGVNGLFLMR